VASVSLPDGRTLCARLRGQPGEHPTVLLHGLLDSSEGWSELYRRLACPYVAVDLPGFGCSAARSRSAIADYARDVTHGLTALGVERFTLVGHSLGGAVATAVAELMPANVQALILLAPVGFGRIHLAEAAVMPGVRVLVDAALPWALSSRIVVTAGYVAMVTNGRRPSPELVERVTAHGGQLVNGTKDAIRAIAAAGRSPHAFHVRRVRYDGPVTAIWGDRDRLVPASHRAGVLTAFPQARIELWRGMGHHPVSERLDDLLALIAAARKHAAVESTAGAAAGSRVFVAEAA
jgi:pimeloyl-ACP methyl ester carboxylesterase